MRLSDVDFIIAIGLLNIICMQGQVKAWMILNQATLGT